MTIEDGRHVGFAQWLCQTPLFPTQPGADMYLARDTLKGTEA
jgi:hypothetical protein